MSGQSLRLLALDGGGVRGLSSLMILQRLMMTVNPESPPKPCDYFDMIGGTSTGGLIAIMLGRLQMTVEECIRAYTSLSDKVFEKQNHRINLKGKIQGRFDAAVLELAVKKIVTDQGLEPDALLKDAPDAPCKVFVCATSKETSDMVCLKTYRSPRDGRTHLFDSTTIWQACRATSAATSFFDPIAIGPYGEEFVDGALGLNNPVYALWNQAQDVWGGDEQQRLHTRLRCLVSIGTGVPALKPYCDDVFGIVATLKEISTETERTAEMFRRDKWDLDDEGRYFRFNVDRGLEDVGLDESKKQKEIAAATGRYVESQVVLRQMKACKNNVAARDYRGPYRATFTLQGAPNSNKFVDRPSVTAALEQYLLPRFPLQQSRQRKIFVLHGLGGLGKTQLAANFARCHQPTFSCVLWLDGRSEDQLKQSLASYARKIPDSQISAKSKNSALKTEDELNAVVAEVLDWLARRDNSYWLMVFDNVDLDRQQGGTTGKYDIQKYFPGDHGSVLITTRLLELAQLGESKHLKTVDGELSKAIFSRWYGKVLVMDESGEKLLSLLDGLPLALAQAAAYLGETGYDIAAYVRLYQQQWADLMGSDTEPGSRPLLAYDQGSVATTWMISLKAIEATNKSAANLLRLWAFVDNKDMFHALLQAPTLDSGKLPDWVCEMASNEARFLNAARLLCRYSMIEANECVAGSYNMHPVVHRWASFMQNDVEIRTFLRLAVMLVVWSPNLGHCWDLKRRLLIHLNQCMKWGEQIQKSWWDLNDMKQIDTLRRLGDRYRQKQRLADTEAMYQWVLEGYERILGPAKSTTLIAANDLGRVYAKQGRFEKAVAVSLRALGGLKKIKNTDHELVLHEVRNLGLLYMKQGRLGKAEEMFHRAWRGYVRTGGCDDSMARITAADLAGLHDSPTNVDPSR
ncbi:acyl transferase/acyl hydrolase/lysophospholipase [Parachaetomium inaequale]|uniref:Acyl transferase/acyl hydrolase/lysophospholipase n=1 Tax=Parachaetomium inaequale TaxID=2588326 RepID=A0AAN6PF19_9PEZI|nr:acyl transferase/acyl hydrolase/lysophospholipase [Parachaetomium inaequale]